MHEHTWHDGQKNKYFQVDTDASWTCRKVTSGNKFTVLEVEDQNTKWHADKRLSVEAFIWSR